MYFFPILPPVHFLGPVGALQSCLSGKRVPGQEGETPWGETWQIADVQVLPRIDNGTTPPPPLVDGGVCVCGGEGVHSIAHSRQ